MPATWIHIRVRAVRAALVAALVLVVGADLGTLAAGEAPARPVATLAPVWSAVARSPVLAATAARVRGAAVAALLSRRGRAVLDHNEGAFLSDVDPSDPAFFAAQQALFASLEAVPFASLTFSADAASASNRPNPARYGSTATWLPDVTMTYRLAGFDPSDATERGIDTFVQRGSRWLLASTSDLAPSGQPAQRELWDYGQVMAVRGPDVLVLGFPDDAPFLHALAAEVERDIPRVSAVWGADWPRRAVLEVPANAQQFAAITGLTTGLSNVEAVQSTEISDAGGAEHQSGNRITINPGPFHQLSMVGRGVVITHELTHVASRASTRAVTPMWLVEGLADYSGFLDSGLPTAAITIELRDLVRTSGIPAALPRNADFASSNPNVAASYEEGWLACRLLATRYGTAQLVRFYQRVGASTGSSDQAVDAALRAVTGQGLSSFTVAWRTYLAAQVR